MRARARTDLEVVDVALVVLVDLLAEEGDRVPNEEVRDVLRQQVVDPCARHSAHARALEQCERLPAERSKIFDLQVPITLSVLLLRNRSHRNKQENQWTKGMNDSGQMHE